MQKSVRAVSWKRLAASVHDAAMAVIALLVGLLARYDIADLPPTDVLTAWLLGFALVAAIVFRLFGLGRGMWRFASITDLRAIVAASTVAVMVFLIAGFMLDRLEGMPRSAPVIAWFVLIVLLGAPRLGYRAIKDGGILHLRPRDRELAGVEHVLIVGSASEADRVIRTYGLEQSRRYKVCGIVDFRRAKVGRDVRGVPIIGEVSELEGIVGRLSRGGITLDAAILAPNAPRDAGQSIAAAAARLALPLRRVGARPLANEEPDLTELTLEDLLGRPPVHLAFDEIEALIRDRVVLITGAGGSIGSELTRQVARLAPARLILVESSEYALYLIDQEIERLAPAVARHAVIADVRDRARVMALVRAESPALVFHAAALKHVPLVEANPCEGALTNVVGTRNVADAAVAAGADAVVVISTDKAIRPTSVMGATKRVAEAYCQALDVSGVPTRFVTVRFGNVLGSNGSVVPLFRRQIESGGPVTVTDPEMRRYFMTIKEATELVLQAAASGVSRDEQRGRISVLDMGDPVKIVDLARTMISLAGRRPDVDVEIVFTGLRPGEKLFEELFEEGETTLPSGADGVFVATARVFTMPTITQIIDRMEQAGRAGDVREVRELLSAVALGFDSGCAPPAVTPFSNPAENRASA